MRAWLELQLIDLDDCGGDALRVRRALEDAFGRNEEAATRALDNAVADYFRSRAVEGTEQIWGGSISAMEHALASVAALGTMTLASGPAEAYRTYLQLRRMHERIRNKVSQYLTDIESDTAPLGDVEGE